MIACRDDEQASLPDTPLSWGFPIRRARPRAVRITSLHVRLRQTRSIISQNHVLLVEEPVPLAQVGELGCAGPPHAGFRPVLDLGPLNQLLQSRGVHTEVLRDLRDRRLRITFLSARTASSRDTMEWGLGEMLPFPPPTRESQTGRHLTAQ